MRGEKRWMLFFAREKLSEEREEVEPDGIIFVVAQSFCVLSMFTKEQTTKLSSERLRQQKSGRQMIKSIDLHSYVV